MKVIVIATNNIVELVTKKGDYFLDTNLNPYLEGELRFLSEDDVVNDLSTEDKLYNLMTRFNNAIDVSIVNLFTMLFTKYPDKSIKDLCDDTAFIVKRIKCM